MQVNRVEFRDTIFICRPDIRKTNHHVIVKPNEHTERVANSQMTSVLFNPAVSPVFNREAI